MLPFMRLLLLVTTSALALPSTTPHTFRHDVLTHETKRQSYPLTVETLIKIAPASASCPSGLSSCRDAVQALPHILASFERYEIIHPATQAAVVSLMAYESDKFEQDYSADEGDGPQCTRNMQHQSFNEEYATSLGLGVDGTEDLCAILNADEFSFGSAAWFMHTQCTVATREALWDGSEAAWRAYVTECVGAEYEDARLAYWQRAMQVFMPGTDVG